MSEAQTGVYAVTYRYQDSQTSTPTCGLAQVSASDPRTAKSRAEDLLVHNRGYQLRVRRIPQDQAARLGLLPDEIRLVW